MEIGLFGKIDMGEFLLTVVLYYENWEKGSNDRSSDVVTVTDQFYKWEWTYCNFVYYNM